MRQLTAPVVAALGQAGLPACQAMPATVMPHLKQAACGVSLRQAQATQAGLYEYLGVLQDPDKGQVELYGRRLEGDLDLQILSPALSGGACCVQAGELAMEVLLSGIDGLRIGRIDQGPCTFDQVSDCFTMTLTAHIEAYIYAIAKEGEGFTDFTLKGGIT